MIFRKHKNDNKVISKTINPTIPYPITNSSSKQFKVNELEIQFFNVLYNKLTPLENKSVKLQRLSDGTFNVNINSYYIGKVKLQGRKHFIQVSKEAFEHFVYYGDIDLLIPHIDEWIKYLKWCNADNLAEIEEF